MLHQAEFLTREGRCSDAIGLLDKAIAEDPLYAAYYYWKGRALLGLSRVPEARENFVKAKDLDVCPCDVFQQFSSRFVTLLGKSGYRSSRSIPRWTASPSRQGNKSEYW